MQKHVLVAHFQRLGVIMKTIFFFNGYNTLSLCVRNRSSFIFRVHILHLYIYNIIIYIMEHDNELCADAYSMFVPVRSTVRINVQCTPCCILL